MNKSIGWHLPKTLTESTYKQVLANYREACVNQEYSKRRAYLGWLIRAVEGKRVQIISESNNNAVENS